MKHKIITTVILVSGLSLSAPVLAHFPLMQCWFEAKNVVCQAGYSDGSTAVDYDVDMFDYDDNLIAKVKTDKGSRRLGISIPNHSDSNTEKSISNRLSYDLAD
ncbi:hypothetical protein ACIPOR_17550 [Photobacterium damselae subsp. piscicida]|uniref:hypothetical protein n=1 Tax=Photobacterium damselae TaxID=38293 RepID=UPI004040B7CF